MKRKERHLTVMGWVVVGLLDTLAGVISGGLTKATESIMLTLPMSTAIGSIWNSLA